MRINPIILIESDTEGTVVPSVFVLLLQSVSGPYSYAVPFGIQVELGSIVRVPLKSRSVLGVVWYNRSKHQIDVRKLRFIERVCDCSPLSQKMCQFIDWVSNYTLSPIGLIARMAVSVFSEAEKMEEKIQFTGVFPQRNSPARLRVMDKIKDGKIWQKRELLRATKVSSGVIDGLKRQGVIEQIWELPSPVVGKPNVEFFSPKLEKNQQEAVAQLLPICADGFSVSLISGVTGSGKTEVYLEAVSEVLSLGKQVLILLPEISLTSAILERFQKRFGVKPAEWHSALSLSVRQKIWKQVQRGEILAVVGARSALFLSFKELGLIVVDEEHDPSYKQEDGITYNARDMSIVRGKIESFPVVLVSATPSIESQVNSVCKRYGCVHLSSRYRNVSLPDLRLIDMRNQSLKYGKFLSLEMLNNIRDTLDKNEQTLLFINRRGYAPLTLCQVCGYRIKCSYCSCWLVEHRSRGKLHCHQCGYVAPYPESCSECGVSGRMIACGPGVERIDEEIRGYFPAARISVLSSDLDGSEKKLRSQLEAISKGEVDIVIGTQLVAKGHNFPRMSLVGIVDGYFGLSSADFRAAERTFQLLSQVTGRAGRFGIKSLGLIQVYQPIHPVMQALVSGDSNAFYEAEIQGRKDLSLPPFGRLAAVIVSASVRQEAETYVRELKKRSPVNSDISVFGPAEAPLFLVRGRYRFRLLLHGKKRNANLQKFFSCMCYGMPKKPISLRIQFDMDPQSFL
ncbi:primosomal protein N' [Candidatus Liberibacter sp.]|uniref:primosomal protein N' n=1 Tax=Candidatus Liberibacter sp. TaxID=34022 RepID=UPI0015F561EB|nr:primosomal protein N' [Candidatus Liberibacter sp.]MBA5723687.1 primosomal protein N' [Candidatus Liberibacter sp.]